ncbi:UNKNOWN [Stylonychia lemnae]|uniref:Uncharacterized protein n=1 Tax=Stylonychia lemnae TaxID=5949 RepID=A0A077ZU73_STYLE|nr:UNKNOWN [Stylonychia lemnae]|eukprot:CDW72835.1 UNKNOWN [Stylonychia lemnae]
MHQQFKQSSNKFPQQHYAHLTKETHSMMQSDCGKVSDELHYETDAQFKSFGTGLLNQISPDGNHNENDFNSSIMIDEDISLKIHSNDLTQQSQSSFKTYKQKKRVSNQQEDDQNEESCDFDDINENVVEKSFQEIQREQRVNNHRVLTIQDQQQQINQVGGQSGLPHFNQSNQIDMLSSINSIKQSFITKNNASRENLYQEQRTPQNKQILTIGPKQPMLNTHKTQLDYKSPLDELCQNSQRFKQTSQQLSQLSKISKQSYPKTKNKTENKAKQYYPSKYSINNITNNLANISNSNTGNFTSRLQKDHSQKLLQTTQIQNTFVKEQSRNPYIKVAWTNGQEYLKKLGQKTTTANQSNQKQPSCNRFEVLYSNSKLEKWELRKKQKEEKPLDGFDQCTFQPIINRDRSLSNFSQRSKRTVDEFVNDQYIYLNKIQEKIDRQRQLKFQEEARSITPTRIANQDYSSQETFDRLHREANYLSIKKMQEAEQLIREQAPFTPSLVSKSKNLQRQQDVSDILYQDAKRRSVSPLSLVNNKEEMLSPSNFNKSSIEYLQKKISLEIEEAFQKYNGSLTSQNQFFKILSDIGYIKEPLKKEDRASLVEIYEILVLKTSQIKSNNLKLFIMALHDVYVQDRSILTNVDKLNLLNQKYGMIGELGHFIVNEQIKTNLVKRFQFMVLNHKSYQKQRNASISRDQSQSRNLNFQPVINEKSRTLANKHRENVSQQIQQIQQIGNQKQQSRSQLKLNTTNSNLNEQSPSVISNFDRLYRQASLLQLKRQSIQDEKLSNETKNCTFTPRLVGDKYKQNIKINTAGSTCQTKSKIFQNYQNNMMKQNYTKITDLFSQQSAIKLSTSQFTTPGISSKLEKLNMRYDSKKFSDKSSEISTANYYNQPQMNGGTSYQSLIGPSAEATHSYCDMSSNNQLQSSSAKNNKKEKKKVSYQIQSESEEEEEPILYANIHIGTDNQTAKLVLYEKDDPLVIVKQFCLKHRKLKI